MQLFILSLLDFKIKREDSRILEYLASLHDRSERKVKEYGFDEKRDRAINELKELFSSKP